MARKPFALVSEASRGVREWERGEHSSLCESRGIVGCGEGDGDKAVAHGRRFEQLYS